MASDSKTVIIDREDLLKAAANASGAGIAAARETFDGTVCRATAMLVDASWLAVGKAGQTAVAGNGYVHGNPRAVVGVAAHNKMPKTAVHGSAGSPRTALKMTVRPESVEG